ncbi:hypothetical protein INQ51_10225 [Maribellus sp. CM-23]|uniref:hypothetical protein n=1 Tax=Maribellus sp. CM-23 TaxID=2781026 RepID=UPI001F3E8339|nr:hypothetical protein [Maribellus sp. CM-23]MCE4564686.1 hypothetical protein [Maribellus sp. CM-23]
MTTKILPLIGFLLLGFVPIDKKKEVRFEQDRFVISFWYDPPVDDKMDIRYKEIADAHFNVVMGGFGANTEANVRKQLELCKKYGMAAIVSLPGFVKGATEGRKASAEVMRHESFPDYDACWGYMLRDEPSSKDFPNLSYMVNYLKTNRPGKLAFINLFPNYASSEQLGTASYEEHVTRFVNEVNPEVLCMDHYPYMEPDISALNLDHTSDWVLDKENPLIEKISRTGYCENLEVLREVSMKKGIPFWNFFNVMPFGQHSDPTEAQLRWQVYTSIAYGAKGILYFCYQSPSGSHGSIFEKGGAILTVDGRKTRHYEEAKRINLGIKNLGNVLMNLESTGVYRVSRNDNPNKILKGTCITELTEGDYLIGEFIHSDGRRAVLINNYSYAYTAWPTVVFDANPEEIIEIDQNSGLETTIIDDSPDMDGLQISLNSGAGRLFLLPRK